jgi:hypothetical protein
LPGHVGSEKALQTSLQGIAKKAQSQKQYRFRALYGLLNEELLKTCWCDIRRDAASGVDRVSAQDYEQHLDEKIRDLVERLKEKRYRAKLVRRHYLPKGDGRVRPLGLPAVEDKLLQLAVARVLGAIYEQDFLPCSYGYRPHVSALHAVDDLTVPLQFGRYQYVVEADLESYFERIDHDGLLRMLAARIDDRALLGLIRKWLKAGILDTEGQVLHPTTGTPQGGRLTPLTQRKLWIHGEDVTHGNFLGGCIHKDFLNQEPDDLSAFSKVQGSQVLSHSLCERSKLLDQL